MPFAPPVGALLAPLGAWAGLVLACLDAGVRTLMAGLLNDRNRSRPASLALTIYGESGTVQLQLLVEHVQGEAQRRQRDLVLAG
jgi:hypothetical protein